MKRLHAIFFITVLILSMAFTFSNADTTVLQSGKCGDDAYFVLTSDKVLTISGTGTVDNSVKFYNYTIDINKIVVEEGITVLGKYSLSECRHAKSIVLPNSLKKIEDYALSGTSYLNSINIPDSIEQVGSLAFNNSNITFTEYKGCRYVGNKSNPYLVVYSVIDKSIETIELHENTKVIATNAIYVCQKLQSISLPDGLLTIGDGAFIADSKLNNIILPDTLEYIGTSAFNSCTSLTNIEYLGSETDYGKITGSGKSDISSKVNISGTHVHDWKTYSTKANKTSQGRSYCKCESCNKIKHSVTYPSYDKLELSFASFDYDGQEHKPDVKVVDSNGEVISSSQYDVSFSNGNYIDPGTYSVTVTFKNHYEGTLTATYKINDCEIESGSYGDNITYSYSEGILTFTGTGKMKDVDFDGNFHELEAGRNNYTPFVEYRRFIKKIVIGEGITSVGDFAFLDFPKLKEVSLPSTLESVGYYAFYNCKSLENIELGDSITEVKSFAFYGCQELSDMDVPNELSTMGSQAFDYAGDTASADDWASQRIASTLEYLNDYYSSPSSTLGFQFYNITPADYKVLESIVLDVTKDCTTDEEKIDAIGNFISSKLTYNMINYDYASYILRTLQGICAGHNQLTAALFKVAGYPTANISGLKRSSGTSIEDMIESPENHQWVMVYYDEAWHVVDTTANYIRHDDLNFISKMYCPNMVDGVTPLNSTENLITLNNIVSGANYYIDGEFTQKKVNGITPRVTGVYNNGAVWMRYFKYKSSSYDHSKVNIIPTDLKYQNYVVRENGLLFFGPTPYSQDGKYFVDYSTYSFLVNEEFAYLPWDETLFTLTVGDAVSVFDDLTSENLVLVSSNTDVVDTDIYGNIIAKAKGKTTIKLKIKGSGTYDVVPVRVIESIDKLTTNDLLQKYCKHKYHHIEYSNINKANTEQGGSYTETEYCRYCGKELGSKSIITKTIAEISLDTDTFEYDGNLHFPKVTVKDIDGNTLELNKDYSLKYDQDSYKVDDYTIHLTFINGYEGTDELEYSIIPSKYEGNWYKFDTTTKVLKIFDVTTIPAFEEASDAPWYSYRTEIEDIELPDNLTSIGKNAFVGITGISTFEIPKSVTSIGENAFDSWSGLKTLTLYEDIEAVGRDAFANCEAIETVYFDNLQPALQGLLKNAGDSSLLDATLISTKGDGDVLVQQSLSGGGNYILTEDGRLTINGTGEIELKNTDLVGNSNVVNVVVNEGITKLSGRMQSTDMVNLYLPGSLKEIKGFQFNTKLENIYFEEGLTTIGESCFSNCTALKKVILPDSVSTIGKWAFNGCNKLEDFSFSKNLESIGEEAFYGTRLSALNLPNSLKSIGDKAFYSAIEKVDTLDLPESLETIGSFAFGYANNISTIIIPAKVKSIGIGIFYGCTQTINAFIPKTVETIKYENTFGPFHNCINVKIYTDSADGKEWIVGWNYNKSTIYSNREAPTSYNITEQLFRDMVYGHDAVKTDAKSATCTEDGNIEYYYCDQCKKYFSDADCTTEISKASTVIAKLPHDYDTINLVPATIDGDGCSEYKDCKDCHHLDGKTIIKQIDATSITLSKTSFVVDGTEHKPTVTVLDVDGNELDPNTDYDIAYSDNKFKGIGKAVITFKGNYAGEVIREFSINKTDTTGMSVELSKTEYTYDGEAKEPAVTVYDAESQEIASSNYEVVYENNVNAGDASVTINFVGEYYEGSLVTNFTIHKAQYTLDVDQTQVKPRVGKTAQIKATGNGKIVYTSGSKSIASVSDTGIVKGVKIGASKITISIADDDNHIGVSKTIDVIVPTVITKATISASSYTYDKNAHKPSVKTVNGSSTKYKLDRDYSIKYTDANGDDCDVPTEAGTYKVIVTGIGNCDGTTTLTYKINQAAKTFSGVPTAVTAYISKDSPEISATTNDDTAVSYKINNTKYADISASSGKCTITAKKAGTATLTISAPASKNYKAASKTVKITVKDPVNINSTKVTTIGKAYWKNGEAISPSVTVKSGKTTFKKDTDYKVNYELVNELGESVSDWEVGNYVRVTADATDENMLACKGSYTKDVKIEKASQPATATAPTTIYYGTGKEAVKIALANIPTTDGDEDPTISYTSSNKKYATVDDEGNITPLKAGKVTITVNIGATKHYAAKTIKLTVNVKSAIELSKSTTQKLISLSALYDDGQEIVPTVSIKGYKQGDDYTVEYTSGVTALNESMTVTIKAVEKSGGLIGEYTKTVIVGKGAQAITINAQPSTVKAKATTDVFTISGVKDEALVSVTAKTYAKVNELGGGQYSVTGIKKGTATVTIKIAATDLYNAKTMTFKVKVTK